MYFKVYDHIHDKVNILQNSLHFHLLLLIIKFSIFLSHLFLFKCVSYKKIDIPYIYIVLYMNVN